MDFGIVTRSKSTSFIIENVNALKSSGPRTPDGKAASSRNSLKHGLTALQVVIPGESQADFDQLLAGLAADRKPEGELEIQTLGEIAASTWRLARARARETVALTVSNDLFLMSATPGATAAFDRILRYIGAIERQLNRATIRLQQLQAERRKHPQPAEKPKVMAAGASGSATYAPPEFVSSNLGKQPAPAAAAPEIAVIAS